MKNRISAWWRGLSTRGKAIMVAVVAVLVVAVGASGSPAGENVAAVPSQTAAAPTQLPVGALKILTPTGGAIVETASVTFAGTAPAGSEVVRDIALASDDRVIAIDGTWTLDVRLDEGVNSIKLRLGDDESTAQTFEITYAPQAAITSPRVTPQPTPAEPTQVPTPDPTPAPTFVTFSDGTLEVGVDVKAGTYRLREPAGFCYWARLKGFGGDLDDIIANDNVIDAYAVVTIGSKDVGFESNGCREWTKDLSRVTDSTSSIDYDGTYMVGTDIKAGKWRSTGGDSCYWARLKGFGGSLSSIIANDIVQSGRTIVTIRSTDKGFLTKACGTWKRG